MSDTLQKLLEECKRGDNDAIRRLVENYQPWALQLASRILDDKDLAEDAVQDAFLAALERLGDLREPDAFPGWFRQIVHTCACRIVRKNRELPLADETAFMAEVESPEQSAEREEFRVKVREALQSLSPAGRETAELFYFDELSCNEIADVLKLPKGTVRRRLHDARRQLQNMLLGYVGESSASKETTKKKDHRFPL